MNSATDSVPLTKRGTAPLRLPSALQSKVKAGGARTRSTSERRARSSAPSGGSTRWRVAPISSLPSAFARDQATSGALLDAAAGRAPHVHYVWRPTLDGIDAKGMHRSLHHKIYAPTGGGDGACTLVNHHPTLFGLCSKKGLLHSLLGYFGALGLQAFNVMPLTFSLPGGADGAVKLQAHVAWREFCRAHKAIAKGGATLTLAAPPCPREWCVANLWLLKPTHLNCGRGIEVIDNPQAVMRRLMRKPAGEAADAAEKGGTPEVHAWVLQKYIERPLLYRGRKFDLRIWCVVSDAFDVYVYEEGYVRTSSETFTIEPARPFVRVCGHKCAMVVCS